MVAVIPNPGSFSFFNESNRDGSGNHLKNNYKICLASRFLQKKSNQNMFSRKVLIYLFSTNCGQGEGRGNATAKQTSACFLPAYTSGWGVGRGEESNSGIIEKAAHQFPPT